MAVLTAVINKDVCPSYWSAASQSGRCTTAAAWRCPKDRGAHDQVKAVREKHYSFLDCGGKNGKTRMGRLRTKLQATLERFRNALYRAAEKIDPKIEKGVFNLPSALKSFFVFLLGGLASEEWENNKLLSGMLLALGFVIAFGAFTFSCVSRDPNRKPKGR